MKDVFRLYHRNKILKHIALLSISWFLAIGINTLLFQTNSWNMLKASVIDVVETPSSPDFVGDVKNDTLTFSAGSPMQNISELSFTLAYDPDSISLSQRDSGNQNTQVDIYQNNPWVSQFILNFKEPITKKSGEHIFSLPIVSSGSSNIINPLEVNFTDMSWETFLLTTKNIIF